MAKYHGIVGFVTSKETDPGVYEDVAYERPYSGDVTQLSKRWETTAPNLSGNLEIDQQISIVADSFAYSNFHMIRYVQWQGQFWKVNKVGIVRPRINISIGGLYNGRDHIEKVSTPSDLLD